MDLISRVDVRTPKKTIPRTIRATDKMNHRFLDDKHTRTSHDTCDYTCELNPNDPKPGYKSCEGGSLVEVDP